MLMITRRPGERIMIGQDVTIELIEVTGSTARIGISAPRSTPVYREELFNTVKQENEAAAGATAGDLAVAADPEEEPTPCP